MSRTMKTIFTTCSDDSESENSRGNTQSKPSVTIIVPCHRADYGLETCLKAIRAQDYCGSIQILVANDGNSQKVHELCHQFSIEEIVVEASGSSYRSRNEALRSATGEVVAFTDANKFPAKNWISTGISVLLSNKGSYIAGSIQVLPHPRRGKDIAFWYECYRSFPIERYVAENHFGVTGNLLVRRSLFKEVGEFDGSLISGGDYEWGNRVFRAGYSIIYENEISVAYQARSLSSILEKAIRIQKGHLDLEKKNGKRIAEAITVRKILRTLIPSRQLCVKELQADQRNFCNDLKVLVVVVCISLVKSSLLLKQRILGRFPEGSFYSHPETRTAAM